MYLISESKAPSAPYQISWKSDEQKQATTNNRLAGNA